MNRKILLLTMLILFFINGCGKKMDPTLEDYLPPESIDKLNLSATYDTIFISWSYPEKAKSKIESFLIERETKDEKKIIGYFSKDTNSLEDKDFTFGKTYKYRIFAIKPKGIYSKPTEAEITPEKLPDVENISYKITSEGVMLSWDAQNSLIYHIYRLNPQGKREKIGSTDKNFFLDKIPYNAINTYKEAFKIEIPYLITTSKSSVSGYMESKGIEIRVPIEDFIASKPKEVFFSLNEQGVYISWREVPERWIKGYKIYRKTKDDKSYTLIGETMIPLFLDERLNINNIKGNVYYKITTEGPIKESEPEEIKWEVKIE